jgi:MFS family permease
MKNTNEDVLAKRGYDPRNFWLLAVDTGAFSFAVNMFSHLTIIPYYLSRLTDSATLIGLGPLIFVLGRYLPQVFSANRVNGLRRRKGYIFFFVAGERVGILLMWLAVLLFATSTGWISIGVFLLSYSVFALTIGMLMPAHADLVARSIMKRRGMFYGVSLFIGGIAGVVGANLATFFLDTQPFPRDFVLIFGVPLIVTTASMLFWFFIREPEYTMPVFKRKPREYLQHLKSVMKDAPEFRKFILVRVVMNLAEIATPFYGVYAAIRFDLSPGVFGLFTLAMFVSQSLSNLVWGAIGDRFGFKPVLQIAVCLGFVAGITALFAPRYEFFFIVYVMVGAIYSAELITNITLGIEYSVPGDTPTYVGLLSSVQAIPLALAPVIGGAIADFSNFSVTIAIAAVLYVFAFLYVSLKMVDPRRIVSRQTLGRNPTVVAARADNLEGRNNSAED